MSIGRSAPLRAETKPPRSVRPGGVAGRTLACLVAVAVSFGFLAAVPATAQTVNEITARWAEGTTSSVRQSEVLNSEWRFNLNDAAQAPANEPVANVFATITATNGTFGSVPTACLVNDVSPVSSVSADKKTLICNFGTQKQGTAIAAQIPVIASGPVGEKVSLSGDFFGVTAATTPIPIVQTLLIDFKLNEPDAWFEDASPDNDYVNLEFPWSLYLGNGSLTGPDTLTYTIQTTMSAGDVVRLDGPLSCDPFTTDSMAASGHPWSGGTHPANQLANFVGSCTLTPDGATGAFTLTLSGIDWTAANAPTYDSAGNLLPADRKVVASGRLLFQVDPHSTANVTMAVKANAPVYTSGDVTVQDDPTNNEASKVIPFRTGWSGDWDRTGTGTTAWDDDLRKSAGASVQTYFTAELPRADMAISECTVLDTRYVTFDNKVDVRPVGGTAANMGAYTVRYYTGNNASLDPESPTYDPNSVADCGALTSDWSTVAPSDPSTVKAVRIDFNALDMQRLTRVTMRVSVKINPDVATGQDIWVWHSMLRGSTWYSQLGSSSKVTDTPNARYPYTTVSRDLLRVVSVTPAVAKVVDKNPIQLGDNVTFTLTYSANGGSNIAARVNEYDMVDTLPKGLTYVAGSATTEPAVTTNADGQQVLTWSLNDVLTNTANTMVYSATTNKDTVAGQVMTNTVVTKVSGLTSPAAQASVTVSTAGVTVIGKSADQSLIPNLNGQGNGKGSWTVSLRSDDPTPQTFTDVIDILPYNGDNRGTRFSGDYAVTDVIAPDMTVYYTTTPSASLSDDPSAAANGSAGDPAGNSVGWTTTKPPASSITAVRVIGGELAPSTTRSFQVVIETSGAHGGDAFVNRAQARASHTELVMRTSAPTTVSQYYAYDLKKYVRDAQGNWHDAQDTNEVDWPEFVQGTVGSIEYKIVVTNTGQGDLSNITVTDKLFPSGNHTIASLASGESNEFVFTADLSGTTSTVRNVAVAHTELPPGSTQTSLPDPSDEANIGVVPVTPESPSPTVPESTVHAGSGPLNLAQTGTEAAWIVLGAGVLLLTGAAVIIGGRRRNA